MNNNTEINPACIKQTLAVNNRRLTDELILSRNQAESLLGEAVGLTEKTYEYKFDLVSGLPEAEKKWGNQIKLLERKQTSVADVGRALEISGGEQDIQERLDLFKILKEQHRILIDMCWIVPDLRRSA